MKQHVLITLFSLLQVAAVCQKTMSGEEVKETITRMGDLLENNYVYPDKAKAMKTMLLENLGKGAYNNMSLEAFATTVYKDLQAIAPDRHMRVDVFPEKPTINNDGPQPGRNNKPRKINPFKKIEFLPGNIAWVVFDNFPSPALCDEYVISAMNSIAGAGAVIFDLRNNSGGSPLLVQLLLSYLLEEKTLYNKVFNRVKNKTEEYRTYKITSGFESESGIGADGKEDKLKGKVDISGLKNIPVYVLTARRTFSAAEEFAYDIQSIKRGTIVGHSTGGGAHAMNGYGVYGRIGMLIPYMRPINPFTETDWEGTGVKPDIEVNANDALKTAHLEALKKLRDAAPTPQDKQEYDWTIILAGYYYKNPAPLTDEEMKSIAGNYGKDVRVFEDGGDLVAEIDLGSLRKFKMQRIDELVFKLDENNIVVFSKDAAGNIISAESLNKSGSRDVRIKAK
jgi:hypothetical protein